MRKCRHRRDGGARMAVVGQQVGGLSSSVLGIWLQRHARLLGCACAGRCVRGGGMGRCIRRRCVQRASSAAKGSRSPAHAHARVRWRADGGGASLAHSRPRCRPVGCRERRAISVLPAGLPEGRRAGLSSGLRILLSTSRRAQCTGSAGACAGRLRGALAGSSVCASAVAAAACRRTPRMAQLGPLPRAAAGSRGSIPVGSCLLARRCARWAACRGRRGGSTARKT